MIEHSGSCPRPLARRITTFRIGEHRKKALTSVFPCRGVDSPEGRVGVVVYIARWSAIIVYVAVNLYAILVRYLSYFCFNFAAYVFVLHLSGVGVRWFRPSV